MAVGVAVAATSLPGMNVAVGCKINPPLSVDSSRSRDAAPIVSRVSSPWRNCRVDGGRVLVTRGGWAGATFVAVAVAVATAVGVGVDVKGGIGADGVVVAWAVAVALERGLLITVAGVTVSDGSRCNRSVELASDACSSAATVPLFNVSAALFSLFDLSSRFTDD